MTFAQEEYTQILMAKKIFLLLIFLSSIIFVQKAGAFEPFINSPDNPLPFITNYPSWNESARYQPFVLFEDGIFKMWYASRSSNQFKIAYATSSDGIHWVGQRLLDVYPGFDNHDPAILKKQNGYTLFFVATTNAGSQNFKIYQIDSIDGINFDQNSRRLVLQPANNLESSAVSSPYAIFRNNTYFLFYLCWGSQFRICMATSTDGNVWERCPNKPVIFETSDGPSFFERDGKNYLFFQSPLGLRQAESQDNLSCNMIWSNFQTPLGSPMIGPTVLENTNQLLLYYSGFSPSGLLIHLATSQLQPKQMPIIFMPGLFASWNKDAILHNQQVGIHAWRQNPVVKEYSGLKATLNNLGYQENEDFYMFFYDWRKKINDITDDFNLFLQEKVIPNHPNSKIDLVGHSLGGLTSRIYGQKFGTADIDKIITIGSPHKGVAQVYKAVEAGEFDRNDSFQWLAQKIILQLNKNKLEADRQTLNEKVPVLLDLFPTYNFLYDQSNNEISIQSMEVKNELFLNYDLTFPNLFPKLQTIAGEKGNTLSGYRIGPRTIIDLLLDHYPDGRPIGVKNEIGDYTVISKSAKADTDFTSLNLDHGEIVHKAQGIKSILDSLQIPYQDSQIIEGRGTKIFPSLIFLILSPANIQVEHAGEIYSEEDGIIMIEDAENGNYLLKVIGNENGVYKVIIGQIGDNTDVWTSINGEISQIPPTSQIDNYIINFDPQNPFDFPVNQNDVYSLFDLLVTKLDFINVNFQNQNLSRSIDSAEKAKQNFLDQDGDALRRNLIAVQRNIFHAISQIFTNDEELFEALVQLENLYDRSLEQFSPKPSNSFLLNELDRYQTRSSSQEQALYRQKQQGKDVIEETNLLLLAQEKLVKAEVALNLQNLDLAEILLKSVKELIK